MCLDYFKLLVDLVRCESVSPDEASAGELLYQFINAYLDHDYLAFQEVSKGRNNIILVKGSPKYTLTTHFDTVPGRIDVSENATRISGRGACDAKGQIVTQLWALEQAITKGLRDYACFFVVGEEVDGIGAQFAVSHSKLGSKFLINGEPTENRFARRSRGVMECTLTAQGIEHHSSSDTADSAIHRLLSDLSRLQPNLQDSYQVNVGRLEGGTAPNMTASLASAQLCTRFEGNSTEVFRVISEKVRESCLTVRSKPIEPVELFVPEQHSSTSVVVHFSSDAAHYFERFEKVMLFGPGSIAQAHTQDEYIEKSAIIEARDILTDLLLKS